MGGFRLLERKEMSVSQQFERVQRRHFFFLKNCGKADHELKASRSPFDFRRVKFPVVVLSALFWRDTFIADGTAQPRQERQEPQSLHLHRSGKEVYK